MVHQRPEYKVMKMVLAESRIMALASASGARKILKASCHGTLEVGYMLTGFDLFGLEMGV